MAKKKSRKTFDDCIRFFQEREQPEDTYCLVTPDYFLDGDSLRRLLIAWPKLHIKRTRAKEAPPSDKPTLELWDWLWQRVSYSIEEWRAIAGVGRNAKVLSKILIQNRLIYPNGEVSKSAKGVVQGVLKGRLQEFGISLERG